jgi:hypothetical protein
MTIVAPAVPAAGAVPRQVRLQQVERRGDAGREAVPDDDVVDHVVVVREPIDVDAVAAHSAEREAGANADDRDAGEGVARDVVGFDAGTVALLASFGHQVFSAAPGGRDRASEDTVILWPAGDLTSLCRRTSSRRRCRCTGVVPIARPRRSPRSRSSVMILARRLQIGS